MGCSRWKESWKTLKGKVEKGFLRLCAQVTVKDRGKQWWNRGFHYRNHVSCLYLACLFSFYYLKGFSFTFFFAKGLVAKEKNVVTLRFVCWLTRFWLAKIYKTLNILTNVYFQKIILGLFGCKTHFFRCQETNLEFFLNVLKTNGRQYLIGPFEKKVVEIKLTITSIIFNLVYLDMIFYQFGYVVKSFIFGSINFLSNSQKNISIWVSAAKL